MVMVMVMAVMMTAIVMDPSLSPCDGDTDPEFRTQRNRRSFFHDVIRGRAKTEVFHHMCQNDLCLKLTQSLANAFMLSFGEWPDLKDDSDGDGNEEGDGDGDGDGVAAMVLQKRIALGLSLESLWNELERLIPILGISMSFVN